MSFWVDDDDLCLPRGRFFVPLGKQDYAGVENAGSLKGLLKPFNGKGLEAWANVSRSLNLALKEALLPRLLKRMDTAALACLDVELVAHHTKAGVEYLRWRRRDFSAMNDALFAQAMVASSTPHPLVRDLYLMEVARLVFNMQMRITNMIASQALTATARVARAEALLQARLRSGGYDI
jgi:hypothetical protein